jgi:hypothetical protein
MNSYTNVSSRQASIVLEPNWSIASSEKEIHILNESSYSVSIRGDSFPVPGIRYSRLQKNIERLNGYRYFSDNWDGQGAEIISDIVIDKSIEILKSLSIQPSVFPTGRGSVQIEYELENEDYLEFEIFENHIECLMEKGEDEIDVEVNQEQIAQIVRDFHGRSYIRL